MANIKISELSPLVTVQDADVLPIVDNAVTKKVTAAILRSYTEGNSVLLTGAQTVAGIKTFTSQLASSVATGTAPFSVASTTKVTNLNADLLDGLSSADFQATLSGTGIVKSTAGTISYLTDNSTNWNTAFNDSITSAAVTGTTTKLLTLNQQDGGTITASWTDDNTDAVSSVFGRTGAIVAAEGDYSLTQLSDVTLTSPANGQVLKYNGTAWVNGTDLNSGTVTSVGMTVPTGLSVSGSPITTSGTLALSMASGYSLPTDASQSTWNTAYNDSIVSAGVTGTSTKTLTLNQQDGGTVTASWSDADTGLTSVGLSMPSAFSVANSPLTANGTLAVTGAGVASQYVRGDGTLAPFPTSTGGGSSVSYYFNGGTNQGTIGGNTYYEMSTTAVIGTNADFNINADGFVAQFVTDANDPSLLSIPAGNWNFEMWFSASSGGGSPSFYLELYKYDGATLTLISSGSAAPEAITGGTAIDLYTTALAVPLTTLALTDRLAVRVYVNHSSKTITLHTQDGHLCQAITTFSTGLTALNGLTSQVQYLAVGTSGTDFGISSLTDTHTFNLPTASATNRGALNSTDWSAFNGKQNAITLTTTGTSGAATLVGATLNIPQYTDQFVGTVTSVSALTLGTTGTDLSSSVANGTTTPVITLNVPTASATNRGALSSADWTTFNNKQNALTNPITGTGTTNYLPKFTGTSALGNSALQEGTSYIQSSKRIEADDAGYGLVAFSSTGNRQVLIGVYAGEPAIQGSLLNGTARQLSINANGGNVGIGTSSPTQRLHLYTASASSLYTRIENANGNTYLGLSAGGDTILSADTAGNNLLLYTAATERMRITSAGNVLIGTTTDAGYKLDVNGTARVKSTGFGVVATFHDTTNNGFQFIADAFSGFNAINSTDQTLINISGAEKLRVTSSEVNFGVPITLSNTIAAAVAVASTHKVTVKIGGVTYYLLASNV